MNNSSGFGEILGHVKIKFSVAEIVGGKVKVPGAVAVAKLSLYLKRFPLLGKIK